MRDNRLCELRLAIIRIKRNGGSSTLLGETAERPFTFGLMCPDRQRVRERTGSRLGVIILWVF